MLAAVILMAYTLQSAELPPLHSGNNLSPPHRVPENRLPRMHGCNTFHRPRLRSTGAYYTRRSSQKAGFVLAPVGVAGDGRAQALLVTTCISWLPDGQQ